MRVPLSLSIYIYIGVCRSSCRQYGKCGRCVLQHTRAHVSRRCRPEPHDDIAGRWRARGASRARWDVLSWLSSRSPCSSQPPKSITRGYASAVPDKHSDQGDHSKSAVDGNARIRRSPTPVGRCSASNIRVHTFVHQVAVGLVARARCWWCVGNVFF